MAGSFQTTTTGQFTSSSSNLMLTNITSTVATTGNHSDCHIQNIPTSATAIAYTSSIVTLGMVRLTNKDATNYVEIGIEVSATFYGIAKLMPGDPPMQFRYDGNALYAKANTAAVDVEVVAIEA